MKSGALGQKAKAMLHRATESPDTYAQRAIKRFEVDGSAAYAKIALVSALVSALLAYHLLIIYGNGNPDAVAEGLHSYTLGSANWALSCGRWLTRHLNNFSGNVVMPGIWVTLYALCVFMSVMLLVKMWRIRSKIFVCLTAIILTVNQTVIEQSLLQYMFMAWGISNTLGVAFVYLNCRSGKRVHYFITAPTLLALAFGLYQSTVSLICLCFCATLILDLIDGRSLKETLISVLRLAVSALIGTALYFIVLKYEMTKYGAAESERVAAFSIGTAIVSLGSSIPATYEEFFSYFCDWLFKRKMCAELLGAALAAFIGAGALGMIKRRSYAGTVCVLALFCLIPAFAGAAKILFPYSTTVTIMQYQNMLLFPLLFAAAERPLAGALKRLERLANFGKSCICLLTAFMCFGYTVSANATYISYELSYSHYNFVTQDILSRVCAMPEYSEGCTIAFAGFIDDDELRETEGVYKYAYGMYDNLALWELPEGISSGWRNYVMDYFGIDTGSINADEYNSAVQSEEFKSMGIYPAEDSIKEINGMIIVKLSDEPPLL